MLVERKGVGQSSHVVFLAVVIIALASLLVAPPVSADDNVCVVVADEPGNAFIAPGIPASAYLDVIENGICKENDKFVLHTEVAGSIPEEPDLLPLGVRQVWWHWGLNTDPTTRPRGFPFSQAAFGAPAEFVVYVAWDGEQFGAFLVDRRANVPGGDVVIIDLDFEFRNDRTVLEVVLDAELIDDPAFLAWATIVFAWFGNPGSQGFWAVQFVGPARLL